MLGDEAEDILASITFDEEGDELKYGKVKEKFENHFIVRRNVIYERAKFNSRVQGESEPVDSFITDLHRLAEYCEYGQLKEEMIRDRLVVGLKDVNLSEKLQLDPDLDLTTAVTKVRQSESVKKQQEVIRSGMPSAQASSSLDAVKSEFRKNRFAKKQPDQKAKYRGQGNRSSNTQKCHRCGREPHSKQSCPARDATCHGCGKEGNFQRLCRSKPKRVSEVEVEDDTSCSELFLGEISGNGEPWKSKHLLNGNVIHFKLDSGADVCVVSAKNYREIAEKSKQSGAPGPDLRKTEKALYGPCRYKLECRGKFTGEFMMNAKKHTEDVYVVEHLETPLLSRHACTALGLICKVNTVSKAPDKEEIVQKHTKLFKGLGCLGGEYEITIDPDVKPFNLTTPRRIPIPQLPKVKEEHERMEKLGVIREVQEPTDWCSPMVVVPKSNDKVRICGDFTQLNKAIKREVFPMPTTEQTLGKLAGAKVFSKLDANSGFWQRKLAEKSTNLTTFITPCGRYCYTRLPFGISSAPEHFQKVIQGLLKDTDGVECQVDDILIFGKDQAEHDHRLEVVLVTLEEAKFTLNIDKCEFSKESVSFLGQIVGKNGSSKGKRGMAAGSTGAEEREEQ